MHELDKECGMHLVDFEYKKVKTVVDKVVKDVFFFLFGNCSCRFCGACSW